MAARAASSATSAANGDHELPTPASLPLATDHEADAAQSIDSVGVVSLRRYLLGGGQTTSESVGAAGAATEAFADWSVERDALLVRCGWLDGLHCVGRCGRGGSLQCLCLAAVSGSMLGIL